GPSGFFYVGQEYDAETGLQYSRARYYDPRSREFIGQDPLAFTAGDTNLYRRVGNSPVNATDPSGLHELDVDHFPPPSASPGFRVISGQNKIIEYLNVRVKYKHGDHSSANCDNNTITIGRDQPPEKQLSHIHHELMSILSGRFNGYAEGSMLVQEGGPYRTAVFPNGKEVGTVQTGIHNLGLIVEIASLAENSPQMLTPDYVASRFATMTCRHPNDQNQKLIWFEPQAKKMAGWISEVFEGKHDGEIFSGAMRSWERGTVDTEKLHVKWYLKAANSRIVGGKVHIVLED
ncbi:MAG: RHS repeat-associated core domain-containing protein, partial [Planctomycetia bacterium]